MSSEPSRVRSGGTERTMDTRLVSRAGGPDDSGNEDLRRFHVEIAVGDYGLLNVDVTAGSPEDAKEEAEIMVRETTIEALRVWETGT